MVVVGEAVPHRNARVLCERLAVGLLEAAEEDAVVDAAEDARGVLDGLLLAEVDIGTRQVLAIAALVAHGDERRVARARRALLEDQRDVLAMEQVPAHAGRAARLELRGEVDEVQHLLVGERSETHH